MDVPELHERATREFAGRLESVNEDQWGLPTPCAGWDVRGLVRHIVYENLWTVPIMEGATVADVGDRFEGEILGDDPRAAFAAALEPAVASLHAAGAMDRVVHLSFGDLPGRVYALQLFADHLIHAWDLARALGVDEQLDPELVAVCADWFAEVEEGYRSAGVVGPRVEVPAGAGPQNRLLAAFGRSAGA